MTTTHTSAHVVAATDGSPGSRAAVVYAAQEATTRGLPLEIVHVMPAYLPAGAFPVAPDAAMHASARAVLNEGADLAAEVAPHLAITTRLLHGARVDCLVMHTQDAALLVVGAPPHNLAERLWTGSTVTSTAARVACPLLIVPPTQGEARRTGRVVVGLKSTQHAEHLLGAAFAVARQTQSDLSVVHAWHLVSAYDDAVAARTTTQDAITEQVRRIEDSMIDLRMAYPDVQVRVELTHGQAAFALVQESAEADLLLVSRPAHGGFVHYLGSTARAVIRESACPVEVVPPVDEAHEVELVEDVRALVP
jgi:nucleotide-binding universal stress UspA family protein